MRYKITLVILSILILTSVHVSAQITQSRIENVSSLPDLIMDFETTGNPGCYKLIITNVGDSDCNPPWDTKAVFFKPFAYWLYCKGLLNEERAFFWRQCYGVNTITLGPNEKIVYGCRYLLATFPSKCYIHGFVDFKDKVEESNESNNEFWIYLENEEIYFLDEGEIVSYHRNIETGMSSSHKVFTNLKSLLIL